MRGKPIVLAPEKVLWPDEISAAILERCDGALTVRQMAETFTHDYAAPCEEIEADVISFLQDWADRLLIDVANEAPETGHPT